MKPEIKLRPFWSAKCPDETKVDLAKSAMQKAIRKGKEKSACYWIRQMYFANKLGYCRIKLWKRPFIFTVEEIGMADLSVMRKLLDLDKMARFAKDDGVDSELLFLFAAVMVCCRAQKSRAVDNAIHWFNDNPTWTPPDEYDVADALDEAANGEKPKIDDDDYDVHTTEGKARGRRGQAGRKHFKEKATMLTNESGVAPFQKDEP